jgi:hypothetical protein
LTGFNVIEKKNGDGEYDRRSSQAQDDKNNISKATHTRVSSPLTFNAEDEPGAEDGRIKMAEKEKEKKHKKHAGHGYKSTHIEHHDDGSHTVRHDHENPDQSKSYAAADLDGVHDGMEDHLGQPNPGEAEAEGGKSGLPEAEAAGAAPVPGMGQ